jgi:hypothetical protein
MPFTSPHAAAVVPLCTAYVPPQFSRYTRAAVRVLLLGRRAAVRFASKIPCQDTGVSLRGINLAIRVYVKICHCKVGIVGKMPPLTLTLFPRWGEEKIKKGTFGKCY